MSIITTHLQYQWVLISCSKHVKLIHFCSNLKWILKLSVCHLGRRPSRRSKSKHSTVVYASAETADLTVSTVSHNTHWWRALTDSSPSCSVEHSKNLQDQLRHLLKWRSSRGPPPPPPSGGSCVSPGLSNDNNLPYFNFLTHCWPVQLDWKYLRHKHSACL